MMDIFAPALTIRYKENADSAVIQTHSLDGRPHYGKPRELKIADLPALFFQLIDRDYQIMPGQHNRREHYREYQAYSPEFVKAVHDHAAAAKEDAP